ncbi:MAG TPA: type II secretion system protein [Acidimicrobiia bacterium]|nr:type II secretion system protein [Acidimicrobiia bacterium]
MFSAIQRLRDRDREGGFTLIELMVVVMIIAILIAIAVPAFFSARKRADDSSAKSSLQISLQDAQAVYTDAQVYVAQTATLTAGDMASILDSEEPNLDFFANGTASANAKEISVDTAASGTTGLDTIYFAAKSKSGKCFYLRHVSTPSATTAGTYKAEGASTATCTAAAAASVTTWVKA